MTNSLRNILVLAVVVLLANAASFAAAPGEATYKAKCASCHGATGTPSAGMYKKSMGIKATSDPETQKLTLEQIIACVKDGKGKMKPVAGLTDDQIGDFVPPTSRA